ncbi:unnamed protein product [Closterium sp. Yama58-4]|nr:unnamed protein product [Closterium sp. Yama58-4]
MTPRVTDPAPAADLPFATESRTGLAGGQSAEAVAADGRTGVGIAEGKRRGGGAGACSTGAADSGDGDDVGSGVSAASELSLARQTQQIASLDGEFSRERNESAAAAGRDGRGDEGGRRAQPPLMGGAAGSAAGPAERVVRLVVPSSAAAGGEPMPPSAAVARESARGEHMRSELVRPASSVLSSLSSSPSASSACSSPPRLFSLCTDSIVANIHHVSSLQGLPEDIVLLLLWRTLQRGALTERVLKVFRATQHALVEEAVVLLGLTHHSPAPVLPTRCTDSSLR